MTAFTVSKRMTKCTNSLELSWNKSKIYQNSANTIIYMFIVISMVVLRQTCLAYFLKKGENLQKSADFGENPWILPVGPGWGGEGGAVARSIWLRFGNHYTVATGLGEISPNLPSD